MLHFTLESGELMRVFDSVEAMDNHIVDQWNSVVRPQDHVYHLGDVAMKWRNIETIARCNGHKRLVRGNHDIFPTKKYLPFFDEIYGMRLFQRTIGLSTRHGLWLTHVPVHPDSIKPNWVNIHGHVHNNIPSLHYGNKYINVSVEVTNYKPVALEELWEQADKQFFSAIESGA